jgi:hypothetical protein
MSRLVPLVDERKHLRLQVSEIGEVWGTETLALQDREPLLDLVHPRAVHRREVHLKTWVRGEPRTNQLAVVDAEVVTDGVAPPPFFQTSCDAEMM